MQRHVVIFAFTFALFVAVSTPFAARTGSAGPAKDVWLKAQSKHFMLIGDASEKEIRNAGVRLEQFREAFSQIFSQIFSPSVINSSVPITVIVFKNDLAYKPFKPLYQGKPADVSGHFQSSGDTAYIALAAGRNEANPYAVIFHEYVHALTSGGALPAPLGAPLPTWLNEGLAEYFSTFVVVSGGKKGRLGAAIASHVKLLRERPLIPLETLLAVDQTSPFYIESEKKNLFYAESWALTHCLLRAGGRRSQFRQFVNALAQGQSVDESFKRSFQTDYATIEQEMKNYISQGVYPIEETPFAQPLGFDTEMKTALLSEAGVQAYLGDLLWRVHRSVDGEAFLNRALSIDPGLAMAHLSLGALRLRQNRYVEARRHLKQAIDTGSQDYLAHYYYALAIHREQIGETQFVSDLSADSVREMRAALGHARQLNPNFADTYKLLAFINLALGEDLDEATTLINRAIELAPHREDIVYTLAQIQMRRKDYAAARQTARTLAGGTAKSDVRERANSMLENIAKIEERMAKMKAEGDARGDQAPGPDDQPSTRPPLPGQRFQGDQVRGFLTRIDCDDASITLTVKSESRSFKFRTTRTGQLIFVRYTPEIPTSIICGAINPAKPVIVTYRGSAQSDIANFDGEPIGVEFVKPDGL
ncbi:MAG TPA: tetratricopeptide repeat protein [Blastocatellia bacterium]|nr:tetratricopeptide repeat protein [Blastocatellia bacterium]